MVMTALAKDLMTREVVTVAPDATSRDIAKILTEHRISAVPVVDPSGAPVGMVSEGDLLGRDQPERERRARDIMASPVQTVAEDSDIAEIARLLAEPRCKEVPVLRDGRIVGIVSRTDLARAIAHGEAEPRAAGGAPEEAPLWRNPFARLDDYFLRRQETPQPPQEAEPARQQAPAGADATAERFRGLEQEFKSEETRHRKEAERAAEEQRHEAVEALEAQPLAESEWQALLQQARDAARHGAQEFMLLRFPSDVCTDGGREINAPLPSWPRTLRGQPAEIYRRWESELRPHGFRIAARVLDFPGGFPGDIGLFLVWGE